MTVPGTSLVVKLKNPSRPIIGYDADVSGKIDIYHEYVKIQNTQKTKQVPGKVWIFPWWFRYFQ